MRHGAIQGTQIPDPSSKYLVRAWGRMGVHHHRSSQQSDLNGSESTKTDAEKQDNDSGGAAQHSTRSTAPSSPRHTATGGRCRYHWDHRAETSYSRQQLQLYEMGFYKRWLLPGDRGTHPTAQPHVAGAGSVSCRNAEATQDVHCASLGPVHVPHEDAHGLHMLVAASP